MENIVMFLVLCIFLILIYVYINKRIDDNIAPIKTDVGPDITIIEEPPYDAYFSWWRLNNYWPYYYGQYDYPSYSYSSSTPYYNNRAIYRRPHRYIDSTRYSGHRLSGPRSSGPRSRSSGSTGRVGGRR